MILRQLARRAWTLYAVAKDRGDCQLLKFLGEFTDPPPPPDKADRLGINKVEMIRLLSRMAEAGPPRNTEISHQIDTDIFQLTKGGVRVLYFYGQLRRTLIFSHGFPKTTPKTPPAEKARVSQALAEYRSAHARGGITYLGEDS